MAKVQGKKIWILLMATLILLNVGCSKKPKTPSPKPESGKKESEELKNLQTSVDALLKEFEDNYLRQTAPTPKPPTQEGQTGGQKGQAGQGSKGEGGGKQQGSGEKGGGSSGGGSQGGEGGQGGGSGQGGKEQSPGGESAKPQEKAPDWSKMEKLVRQIHENWNTFQPEAAKAGAGRDKIEDFSRELDETTMAITGRDLYRGLISANELYLKNAVFDKFFKAKAPPPLKEVVYQLRRATYMALHREDESALASIRLAQEIWADVKPQLKDNNTIQQADFSLRELEQAIKAKDPNLIKIRGKISETNLLGVMKEAQSKKG